MLGVLKGKPDGKGGVRVSKSVDEVRTNAEEMLGHTLITKQTGPAGKEVKRLYIEEGCDIARELYLGMLLDRETSRSDDHGFDRGWHGDRRGCPCNA